MTNPMVESTEKKPLLSGPVYDLLKYLVQLVLPAAGTLYFTLAQIWSLQYGEQVVGTVTAISLFGGVVLKLSQSSYDKSDAKYDGQLIVDTSDEAKDIYRFQANAPLEELKDKKELTFKVEPTT